MLEWDDLRTFLAICRHGSLSAAARALGVTQTTMGRRLDSLHDRAGAILLVRVPGGYRPTAAGERVLGRVETIESEVLAVERAIVGEDTRLTGHVRVTTIETFATRVLVSSLSDFAARYPELTVELDADPRCLSLARREADIAVRLIPFEQNETVVQKVGRLGFGIYASPGYLDRFGMPDWTRGAAGHKAITLQTSLPRIPEADWFDGLTKSAPAVLRTNSREGQLRAALAGLGLACLPRCAGDSEPALALLPAPSPGPVREIWAGVHPDISHVPRIRAVLDHITQALRNEAARLAPDR